MELVTFSADERRAFVARGALLKIALDRWVPRERLTEPLLGENWSLVFEAAPQRLEAHFYTVRGRDDVMYVRTAGGSPCLEPGALFPRDYARQCYSVLRRAGFRPLAPAALKNP